MLKKLSNILPIRPYQIMEPILRNFVHLWWSCFIPPFTNPYQQRVATRCVMLNMGAARVRQGLASYHEMCDVYIMWVACQRKPSEKFYSNWVRVRYLVAYLIPTRAIWKVKFNCCYGQVLGGGKPYQVASAACPLHKGVFQKYNSFSKKWDTQQGGPEGMWKYYPKQRWANSVSGTEYEYKKLYLDSEIGRIQILGVRCL